MFNDVTDVRIMSQQKHLQDLTSGTNRIRVQIQEFRQRIEKLNRSLTEEQLGNKTARLDFVLQQEVDLMADIQMKEAELKEGGASWEQVQQQVDVGLHPSASIIPSGLFWFQAFARSPERRVPFNTGTTDGVRVVGVETRFVYPMEGGTALVTFEETEVAMRILTMQKHRVSLGDGRSITVGVRPVVLIAPSSLEMETEASPRSVSISNLPRMDPQTLVDSLEIHFSRRRHGGGEVEVCQMVPDSWTAVLTFVEKDVVKGLTDQEFHKVKFQQKKERVRVTPFVHGRLTDLQTQMTPCLRTLLLTGIPDVMEQETLQDLLEIHFQKTINGGGEVEALLYNPLGQNVSAVLDKIS
ncbi:interferon-induced 35 kDa protein isoform X2 [Antennarius striatus]|uniref:interferon-induced 35 kDa protein isoform X2 n=2 Tax=Antennarius striatus TaxID=241820 RepID=UPI0035AE5C08